MMTTRAAPIRRPVVPLLLQPWSTAMSQMKNRAMATMPTDLSHIEALLLRSLAPDPGLLKVSRSPSSVTAGRLNCRVDNQTGSVSWRDAGDPVLLELGRWGHSSDSEPTFAACSRLPPPIIEVLWTMTSPPDCVPSRSRWVCGLRWGHPEARANAVSSLASKRREIRRAPPFLA